MACTPYPAPALGLFINADQGVWSSVDEVASGGKSANYTNGTLVVSGPTGNTAPIAPGLNQKVRHKFFGTNKYLAVLVSDTVAPISHRLSIVNFNASPPQVVLILTTPIDPNPPLPFVQYDTGPGSACCIGGSSNGQLFGVGIYRSDTGEILASAGGPFTPNMQVIGEAVAAGVQVKHGGTVIAGPAPIPKGELSIPGSSQNFGQIAVGGCPQPPATKTFTLKNSGNDCLTISTIANDPPFSLASTSQPLPATLSPNDDITATVQFAPSAVGNFNGTLNVTRNPANGDSTLQCTGKGVAATASFSVQPASPVNFDKVQVGSSKQKSLTIKNNGTMPISINVAPSTPANAIFRWNGVTTNLGCGDQIVLDVGFFPTADGPAPNGTLVVNATPGGSKNITLTGAGCIPNAAIVVPPAPFPNFGQVRQGYRMPRFITVTNTGDSELSFTASISGPDAALFGLVKPSMSVTDVTSSRGYAILPTDSCAGGPTGPGKDLVGVVFFANAAPPKVAQATLTISNHNDPTAPATFTYQLTAEVIAANVVDVVAVFDRSGSMADPVPGGNSKMAAAIGAGRLLMQLLPADVNNRVAATLFSSAASTFVPITVVTNANQANLTNSIADPPLTPSGSTAIAAGAMVGMTEFATPHPAGPQNNLTKAMIVLTDGMDNTAYLNPADNLYYTLTGINAYDPVTHNWVPTHPFIPPTDVKVYGIGFGTSDDIDVGQLAALSSGTGGYYLTVDPTKPEVQYELMKYYTQIYMDIVDTSVLKDPRDTIYPGTKHIIEFDMLRGDVGFTIVIYDFLGQRLPFYLESPRGELVDAAFVPAGFSLRAGFTEAARFLDVVMPWTEADRYAGRWKLIVVHDGEVYYGAPSLKEGRKPGFVTPKSRKSRSPVDYGYMIGAGSNFRLQAFLNGGAVQMGQPIRMTGVPTEAGLPVTGCTVTVDVKAPNGQVWPGIVLHDDGAHDDGDSDDGEYAAVFMHTAQPGSYMFTFRASGVTRDGEPVHREVVRAKMVEGYRQPPGGGGRPGGGKGDPDDEDCCRKLLGAIERQNRLLTRLLDAKKPR